MSVAKLKEIEALPKLELHIHLEGCISLDFIKEKALEKDRQPPRPFERLFKTDSLSEFLETLDWICSLVDTVEDAKALAHAYGRYCVSQNIIYAEVIINPTHWGGLHFSELLPALAVGFDEVEAELAVDIRLLPSLLRQQSGEEALVLADWIVSVGVRRIAGISVDGNEKAAGPTGEKFASAYKRVREAGLGCTAHAGESSGPEGVRSALDDLNVHRIDHGVRVIEDEALTQRLINEGITLNVCVWSNCHRMYPSAKAHPFLPLFRKGVPITLNTDDPIALGKDMNQELQWVSSNLDLSMADLITLQKNAIEAAFCDNVKKSALLNAIS